jgi:hypothetical protein
MKTKHQIKKYGILSLLFILIAGCNDFLDLKPKSTISPSSFWKTENDAKNWMAGIYNQMQKTLQLNWYNWGEVRSDNNDPQGTGTAQLVIANNNLNSSETSTAAFINWQQLYVTVLLCNTAIKHLPDMIEKNIESAAATYTDYLGQCYGMRALMYFYALRVWGRIPLVIDAIEDGAEPMHFSRASIKEIRNRIESDALQAIGLLNPLSDNSRKYYLSQDAVYALLTELYATFQEYDKVIETSDDFLSTTACTWVAGQNDWKLLFTDPVSAQATENIFVMYWNYVEYGGGMGYADYLGSEGNTARYRVRNGIFQKLYSRKSSDVRWGHCFDSILYETSGTYERTVNVRFGKCFPWNGTQFIHSSTTQCEVKMPIYRYADVMTLRAEALALTGKRAEALAILQKLRSRVGYNPSPAEDPTNYEEYYDDLESNGEDANTALQYAILDERQLEFLGEGKRWFDLCRVGKTIYTQPYYDGSYNGAPSGNPPYRIAHDSYQYLRDHVNAAALNRTGFLDFEGDNVNRILFPIISGAFTANSLLRGDQNLPYDE